MKRTMIVFVLIILGAILISACTKKHETHEIVRGAQIKGANGIFFDKNDRLYIGSVFGREIILMDPNNGDILERIGPDRSVETPDDVTFGPDGSLYWTAVSTGDVGRLTPDGKMMTVAQNLPGANPITFSQDGRLFVALRGMGKGLFELDPDGVKPPRPIDEDLADLNAFAFGPDGKLYAPRYWADKISSIDVDTGVTRTVAEGFKRPVAVKFDGQGRLFALDDIDGKVFLVNIATGGKTEYAVIEPGLDNLAFDSLGRLFVSNYITGAIYEVLNDRSVRIVSSGNSMTSIAGIAVLSRDNEESVFVPSLYGIVEIDGRTGQQRNFVHAYLDPALLPFTMTLATDGKRFVISSALENSVQVWDHVSNTVLHTITGLAGPTNAIYFQGDIVISEAGSNPPRVARISLANPESRTTIAELTVPLGLAATAQDLWATDFAAGTVVQIVKEGDKLIPSKVVADDLKGPEGMAIAPDGNLLVVESQAGRLLKVNPDNGAVSTVAENLEVGMPGPAIMPFWLLDGVVVGPSGAIYVAGTNTNTLYRIQ